VPMVDWIAGHYGRFVAMRSDAELEAMMAGWRRLPVLWGIFRIAPHRLDRAATAGERTLIEIRVRDPRGGPPFRRQLLIGRGRCAVSRHDHGEAESTITFDPVDFLRFAAGQQAARDLFLSRRVSVDGSLLAAAELPSFFRFPEPSERPG
jgi:hypothetical protein